MISAWMLNLIFGNVDSTSVNIKIGLLFMEIPKSFNCCFIHIICAQQLPAAIYSTLAVERAIEFCFLLDQETSIWLRNGHVPLVLYLLVLLLA